MHNRKRVIHVIAYGKSDRGSVRPTNQDAYAIDILSDGALLAVCDGMGGANAGNVASRFAIETFMAALRERFDPAMDSAARRQLLMDSVQEANHMVFDLACAQPEFRGMGTTLIGGIVTGNSVMLINVGDSRAYRVEPEGAVRITKDHSYVEEMIRRGKLTEEAARVHPNKNLITRAIGIEPEVSGDVYETSLTEGEALLLCSDGLSGSVLEDEIAALTWQSKSLEEAVPQLIDRALQNGSTDNITVVLCGMQDSSEGKE